MTSRPGVSQAAQAAPETRFLEERAGVRLVVRRRSASDIGDVITSVQSPQLIPGVEIEPLIQWPDDRGCFAEIFRFGAPGIARDFASTQHQQVQVSFTISYPGVIKAIHYHLEQTDLWAPLDGMFQVFLCDLREDSPRCGSVNTVFVGSQRPWKMRIPPGIAHGYKVVGPAPAHLLYATNHFYDPRDEGRLPYDDPDIKYDWQTRPR